jgi:glycerophosphoryl diester phosphodiesterase
MLFEALPQPAIVAHRGASAYAPENTLAAFKLALQQGADGIELDAKLSSDGHVVVIHDQTVDRTTPFHGKVSDFRLAELRKMDAGSHFDIAFKGEPIPTLEEVFKAVGQLTYINVELTNYGSLFDSLPEKVAELVRHFKLSHRVSFSSFSPIALRRIRRLVPEAPIGLLAFSGMKGWPARGWPGRILRYHSLNPDLKDTTSEMVHRLQRRGCWVYVYTVNREDEMWRLFDMGVDGIFTDDPLLAQKTLNLYRRKASQSPKEISR